MDNRKHFKIGDTVISSYFDSPPGPGVIVGYINLTTKENKRRYLQNQKYNYLIDREDYPTEELCSEWIRMVMKKPDYIK